METALVFNPTAEEIKVQVYGNWFTFKAGQVKQMQKEIADFLVIDRSYLGFIGLPTWITEEDPGVAASPEEQAAFAERKKEEIDKARELGVQRRVAHLERIVTNLEVSLRRDLEQKNMKVDPLTMATPGERAAYKELAKYKNAQRDAVTAQVEEIKKLKEQISGNTDSTNA